LRKEKIHHAWWIMVASCFIMACGLGIIYNCAGIFFKPVGEALGINRGPLSLYMTVMNITMTLFLPLAGRILTRYRTELVVSLAFAADFMIFGSLSLARSVGFFYLAAVLMGFLPDLCHDCHSLTGRSADPAVRPKKRAYRKLAG